MIKNNNKKELGRLSKVSSTKRIPKAAAGDDMGEMQPAVRKMEVAVPFTRQGWWVRLAGLSSPQA